MSLYRYRHLDVANALLNFDQHEQSLRLQMKTESEHATSPDAAHNGEKCYRGHEGVSEFRLKICLAGPNQHECAESCEKKAKESVSERATEHNRVSLSLKLLRTFQQNLFVVFHGAGIVLRALALGNGTFVPRRVGETA